VGGGIYRVPDMAQAISEMRDVAVQAKRVW
jgi:hypothetical protein